MVLKVSYRKVFPIRPGLILSDLPPFSKKYRKFEKKKLWSNFDFTGPDLDLEKIEKIDDRFGR